MSQRALRSVWSHVIIWLDGRMLHTIQQKAPVFQEVNAEHVL